METLLKEGRYTVAKGCKAALVGNSVVVKPENLVRRCKDCRHCIQGFAMPRTQAPTMVCAKRPKGRTDEDGRQLYYSTNRHKAACIMFERTEQEKKI